LEGTGKNRIEWIEWLYKNVVVTYHY